MSESRLRNLYLPPFKAAIDAGADTVMCSFNAINGVPGCANHDTETDILKNEWGFDGFIESDYTAVAELRACPPKTPDDGPVRPRRRRRRARTPAQPRSTPAPTPRWSARTSATTASSCSPSTGSRWRGSTTPCAGSCASSSAPACSTTPTSTRPRPPTRRSFVTADRPRRRAQRGRRVDGAAQERRRRRCRSTRPRRPR